MEIMNPTTVTKCLILQHSAILPELQEIVKSYLFYDTKTAEYQHRKRLRTILSMIDDAWSRKNGFCGLEDDNTEIEQWSFSTDTDKLQIQAINCRVCGEYCASNTMFTYLISDALICQCSINHAEEENE